MNLLQMSISASVMILVVTAIRALAINHLPKMTFLVLWGIIIGRLVVPFRLPSPLSVYSLLRQPMAAQLDSAHVVNVLPISPALPSTASSAAAGSPWLWIWGIGLVLCALYFTAAYLGGYREFQNSQPVENTFVVQWLTEHSCKRPIAIREARGISAPLTYGFFRPVILMPLQTDWSDKKQLQYIFAHEYVHIKRFDGATKLLLTAALCIHWFNPLVWMMYLLANRDIELSCDEKVIRTWGENIKSTYALVLINMEEKKSGLVPFVNNFSKNAVEERIEAIMKMKKTSAAAMLMALCLIGGVTAVFATSASAHMDNIETGVVLARKTDMDSPYQYSVNHGDSWISEEAYHAIYPQDEIVWWTYDAYKSWLEEERLHLQSYVGSDAKYKDKNGQWVKWTQEHVNTTIRGYEETLESIKNGAKVSKTINGEDSISMIMNPPGDEEAAVSYGVTMTDNNGGIVDLGTFSSKEERFAAVQQYCGEQVKSGKLSPEEADRLMQTYQ